MNKIFSDTALIQLREAIADAGGNEVFFLGRTDTARVVIDVEPLARGNRDAVAAILSVAAFGDVVIHNHPSGHLTPSNPDIEIASILGNQGVGFYIIDNDASRCYQAVAAFARRETALLSFSEIENFLRAGGDLAIHLPEFEHRDEQVRMAYSVGNAFNEDKIAVIEAGTGTGKSLAYLVPAVWWGVRNRDRVVVSTNTINLQEQLIKKDIPLLRQAMGVDFRAVLVKGRSNYLCRRKLEGVKAEPTLFPDEAQGELQAILEWSAKTKEGCRSDLAFIPRDDVWEEVACEADQCARIKCPNYARCFFYTARREAAGADILVVNHALLMSDLALRAETGYGGTAVLPPFNRIIIDEGHHLEDVATSHLSSAVSRNSLLKLLGKLQNPRKQEKGLLPRLSAGLSKEMPEEMDALFHELSGLVETVLMPAVIELHDDVTKRLDRVGVALLAHLKRNEKEKGEQKLRVTASVLSTPFWLQAEEEIKALAGLLSAFVSRLREFLKAAEKLPEKVMEKLANVFIDVKGVPNRIENAVSALHDFTAHDDTLCRWFEVRQGPKGMIVRFCSSPLEVAAALKGVLLDRFKTIILTSATLAVGDRFDFLKDRTGISLLNPVRVTELLLPSPFDYAHQAFVGIPSTMPEPGAPGFERALEECLLKSLTISEGRAFVLFTSYDLLRRMHNRLFEPLKRRGMTVLKQGEMNRHLLLSRFRKEPNPVLFGTDSFWEGVDVKGRALELVVMARLPFRVPTEPILEARAEHIERSGGDSFRDYAVPQAVIKFKQGFGRLIRSRDDRGGVLVLDSRVLTKPYGRMFLKSLPDVALSTGSEAEVLAGLENFFTSVPESAASR